jgi:hypothetical protein
VIPTPLDTSPLAAAVSALITKSLHEIPAHAFDRLALVVIYDKLLDIERTLTPAKRTRK